MLSARGWDSDAELAHLLHARLGTAPKPLLRPCSAPSAWPTTGDDSAAQPESRSFGTAIAATASRPVDIIGRSRLSGQQPSVVEVQVTWGVYQQMIAAYKQPDRGAGREIMSRLIESLSKNVPAALVDVITLADD